jgi:hypothetical protein
MVARPSHADLLRHALASLAYRAAKMIRDAPAEFAAVRACPTCRCAGEIAAHLGDLREWELLTARGEEDWRVKAPRSWEESVERFFRALEDLDHGLASKAPHGCPPARMLQGPLADALTHVGQLATLRRLAAEPVRGEDYSRAEIVIGPLGSVQAPPVVEFDERLNWRRRIAR